MTAVIAVHGLGKRFQIGLRERWYRTVREEIVDLARFRRRAQEEEQAIWAFRNVDMSVNRGDVLGLIGRNGAGKSTLLKILSRITEPTEGRAELRGRVGSLLEVGTGFHPELSGRENILLSGAMLGMRRREILAAFDQIVEFADVTKFIDTPLKHFSSGMYLRLAFAVAAHLNPEILLVDEVLAVGDAEFQRKCLGKMKDVATQGRTVIFVSHNLAAVSQLCTKGVVLDAGGATSFGSIAEAVQRYESLTQGGGKPADIRRYSSSYGMVEIVGFEFLNGEGREEPAPGPFEDLLFRLHLRVNQRIARPGFGLEIRSISGVRMLSVNSIHVGATHPPLEEGVSVVEMRVMDNRFTPGPYRADFWVQSVPKPDHAFLRDVPIEIQQRVVYGTRKVDSSFGCIVAQVSFVTGSADGEISLGVRDAS